MRRSGAEFPHAARGASAISGFTVVAFETIAKTGLTSPLTSRTGFTGSLDIGSPRLPIYSRPQRWYLGADPGIVDPVIRARGAASISMGRTPHEMYDEMCSARAS